jgi:nitrogen fixation NifU-like protein
MSHDLGIDDELYKEVILDHYKNPRNKGKLSGAGVQEKEGMNPLCGDEITLYLITKDGKIQDVRFEGHGCSISQASASLMTQVIKDKELIEVLKLTNDFKDMLLKDVKVDFPDHAADLEALEGVKKYPVRIKCALLSWNVLLETLQGQS